MDSLQKQFGNDIEIMVVGYERKSRIEDFLKTNRVAGKVRLPFVTGDSVLKKMFPYRMLPQEVWIDKTGVVKAITKSVYVNAGNIQALLDGKDMYMPLKKDLMEFERNKPLLVNNNGGSEDELLYKSVLTKYLKGVGSMGGSTVNADSTVRRIYFTNQPVLNILLTAYSAAYASKVLLEVKDKTKYTRGGKPWDTWSIAHAFCYEQTLPVTASQDEIARRRIQDLSHYFNIIGSIEKRVVKCLVLKRTGTAPLPATKGGKEQLLYKDDTRAVTLFQNQPITQLVNAINGMVGGQPYTTSIIDETGYNNNIDLQLKSDLDNITSLNTELQQYGLILEDAEREMEMLVVREK